VSARCPWADKDPLYFPYHDQEWGVPSHDERHLFEMLILEGAQAGSPGSRSCANATATDARSTASIRRASRATPKSVSSSCWGIRESCAIGRRSPPRSRTRARSSPSPRKRGSFDRYLWSFVGGKPRQNRFRSLAEVPARTPESDALSKDLAKRGFKFVGSTICYAYMQAVGLVNDHLASCPRHAAVRGLRST